MDDKALAHQKLAALLGEFSGMHQRGSTRGQSEATARTWVERFLGIFGWNSSDPHQVKQEYRIQGRAARRLKAEGITHRRPDYCLISNNQRVLYIDVKKFDADLKNDSSIAYQVRCYGWSEGFKVSYAFDFEELAVYDCRIRPEGADDAHVGRVLYLDHSDYLANFDTLWEYFSQEALTTGSLSRLLPDDRLPKGSKPLDQDFEEKLSSWRKELAKSILRYGKDEDGVRVRDVSLISAAAQRILDRIVFLRFCEEFGYEEAGSLYDMGTDKDGFWPRFLEEHEKRYATIYDGILFPASEEDDPTGVEAHLRSWWLKGRIFRDIVLALYYPQPYCFDAIPIEFLGNIYERYLGKRLRIVGNDVEDGFKPEHQRTKGAVYTPLWVVRRVVIKTLAPLTDGKEPEEILRLRILDPACGSASFLLGVYDFIEQYILDWFAANPSDARAPDFVAHTEDGLALTHGTARRIINGCLYGVDIDAEAVEVARMSLALRYLDRTAPLGGDEPHLLLKGIGLNIRQGNALVGPDIVGLADKEHSARIIREVMPFDWHGKASGFGSIMESGGFDAVVGNPPYIEVKRYREWMPEQYKYMKESGVYETTAQGKTDIAMPFMELGMRLLRAGGRLGFIIQNRFFKTDYGAIVRSWLRRHRALAEVEDFRDLQVFKGRTTYTAILILQKDSPEVRYRTYETLQDAESGAPSVDVALKWDMIDDTVWAFDQPDLLEVYQDLAKRHGTIGQRKELQISVGLQTLYGKIYQFETVEVKPRTVVGRNGDGEEASLERAALRPLCRNRGFYPFRLDNADAWVIFPYDIGSDGHAREVLWKEFKERYPKAAAYLWEHKKKLKAVEVEKGAQRWHLYTRPQNLVIQAQPKVLFPSTIEDTIAAVDEQGNIYQDNVRINSISFEGASIPQLRALACLFNSTIFNSLAKLKAGLSDSGWRQFNRQYAELVPFPAAIVEDAGTVKELSGLAEMIADLQDKSLTATTEGERTGFRATIEAMWHKLDEAVEAVYGLTKKQRDVLRKHPRRVNRYDLLSRQAAVPEDDE